LKLPDEEANKGADVVRSFSKRSAVDDELVLENLLRTIHREHARYVGVVATDVEDLIFLVHEIRSNCPNVVVSPRAPICFSRIPTPFRTFPDCWSFQPIRYSTSCNRGPIRTM
jgi:hypothetical protein